jgi:hypothetical protein
MKARRIADEQGEKMNLLSRCWLSRLIFGAANVWLLAMVSSAAFAGVIYEYRQDASPTVIGTLEIASPPASASIGWSTAAPSALIALFLDNAILVLALPICCPVERWDPSSFNPLMARS